MFKLIGALAFLASAVLYTYGIWRDFRQAWTGKSKPFGLRSKEFGMLMFFLGTGLFCMGVDYYFGHQMLSLE